MSTARSWVTLIALTAATASLSTNSRGQTETAAVFVDDPRPLSAAVLSLIQRYPITITYEDPRYEFAGDIRDVTNQVRKNPGRRVLGPSGGVLEASYQVSRDTGNPVSVADTIQRIVEAKNLNPVGGRFNLYPSRDVFHIVPTEIRDSNGVWIEQQSIFSAPITFASEQSNGYELIEAILKQVSAASGQEIRGPVATRLMNPLVRYTGAVEARDEPAREVLMRVLHSISPRFTYWVSYDPTERNYWFTVVQTAEPAPPEPSPIATPRPGDPTPAGPPFRPRND